VLVQAPTLALNPTFDRKAIDAAYAEDPASAAAEYGAQFRSDVESFVAREAVDASTVNGRLELAPISTLAYEAIADPSGGSGTDSFTLAIGHREARGEQTIAIVDALRETKPPFSPADTIRTYAELLKAYRVDSVRGDRFAGEFPRELFREHGITYELLDKSKSDYYIDALALFNSLRVELLDHPRANTQICTLERRTARGGRDRVDHAPGGHDDLANVISALAVQLAAQPTAFDWKAAGMTSPVTFDLDDDEWGPTGKYAHLPSEVRQREREAQRVRREWGWEDPSGRGTIRDY
jgi:hypothetical protein